MNAVNEWADLAINDPYGNLYIVADSHLDHLDVPYGEFIEMLNMLARPQMLVCLGDLFRIWLAPPKFWTDSQRRVMVAFSRLRERGCEVVFVAGNREMLLPRNLNGIREQRLPFDYLSTGEWRLEWCGLKCAFIHGDTINTRDVQYLRWRAISHSTLFEALFHAMPGPLARWIARSLEKLLSRTNREYKIEFPEAEIRRFAESVLEQADLCFVGHFHLDREIRAGQRPGIVRLTPDWLTRRALLRMKPAGDLKTLYFQEGRFLESTLPQESGT